MKKLLLNIITLSCLCTGAHAQMIHEGDMYRDEGTQTTYYVIRAGEGDFITLTDESGSNRISLNKVSKLSEDYTLAPSRHNDEPPFAGVEFGWPVKCVSRNGMGELEMYSPEDDLVHTLAEVHQPTDRLNREYYHFDLSFINDDEEYVDLIFVRGYVGTNDIPCVIFEEELYQRLDELSDSPYSIDWVDDKTDINFDSIPDLQIYLGCDASGQMPENYYAGYVWDNDIKHFVKVKNYDLISNPVFDPGNRTITGTVQNNFNQLITKYYEWEDGQLKLTDQITKLIPTPL